jgi:hypothetical protein
VRETWRRLVVAWHALRGAILRVPLDKIATVMARVLEHLSRTSDTHRIRQADVFLNMIRAKCG